MRILIIAVGKEKDFAGHELVREYSDRIKHYFPVEWKYISTSDQKEENLELIESIEKEGRGSYAIALDEKGKELDSAGFSARIQSCMNESFRTLIFIVGGSYGLNEEVNKRANSVLALSKLTFPHQLVRLILAEQIYRACTIIKGEKYHH